jgi:hypothetical protein
VRSPFLDVDIRRMDPGRHQDLSKAVAHRRLMHSVEHRQSKYLNNRAENSH